jgi:hypothetical protein
LSNLPTVLSAVGYGGGSPGGSGGYTDYSSSLTANSGCVMIYYDTSDTNSFPKTDLNVYSNLISHSHLKLKQYLTLPSGEFSPIDGQLGYFKEIVGTGTSNITSGVAVPGMILSVLKGTYIINAKFVFNIATAGTTMSFYIGTTVSNSIEGQTQYYARTGDFTVNIPTINISQQEYNRLSSYEKHNVSYTEFYTPVSKQTLLNKLKNEDINSIRRQYPRLISK